MRASIWGVMAVVAGLALPVAGQAPRSRMTTVTMGNPAPAARLPYTAEYKTTAIQTLASGATITHETTETVALDSQGRRMNATTSVPLLENQTPITRVSVSDPVARTNSSWTVPGQKATVVAMPALGATHTGCATSTAPVHLAPTPGVQRQQPTVEDLGTETIQGVVARGRRVTTTTPAGAIGNDAPLTSTMETWTATAPGLRGLMARNVIDNPLLGKTNKELTNFTQGEPDLSVFQPPEGYEIVNKPAPSSACPTQAGTESSMAPIPPPPTPEQ